MFIYCACKAKVKKKNGLRDYSREVGLVDLKSEPVINLLSVKNIYKKKKKRKKEKKEKEVEESFSNIWHELLNDNCETHNGLKLMSKYFVSYPNFSDLNKWRDIAYTNIRKLYIIKMTVLPKFFPRSNTISIKISTGIFIKINKLILRFMWKSKGSRIAKEILRILTFLEDLFYLISILTIKL